MVVPGGGLSQDGSRWNRLPTSIFSTGRGSLACSATWFTRRRPPAVFRASCPPRAFLTPLRNTDWWSTPKIRFRTRASVALSIVPY
jgi:hypothetical protein